ncbi:hypothetical protein ACTA71_009870 [Dictyostelium dimigraforme]
MKLIVCLIFLTLSFIGFSKSTQISNQYVNFVVYGDADCSTPSITGGFGYSAASDTCLTLDFKNNFLFTVNGGKVSWGSYENNMEIGEICSTPNSPTQTYPINSCIPSTSIYLNSATGVTKQPFYYKVTTSSTPYLPTNSYINSFMGEQCTENYIVVLEYYINNTRIFSTGSPASYLYYCEEDNNWPSIEFCTNGLNGCQPPPKSSGPACIGAYPFYNTTGGPYFTSSCSNCCTSGSCSATSGPATSGSYTGEGWSNPNDDTEQKIKLVKNDKTLSVLSTEISYYQYPFCI